MNNSSGVISNENPKNYTSQLMREQENQVLLNKIQNMRSSVDNRSPQQFLNYQSTKPKSRGNSRHNINLLKKKEIEMENNALISKMLKIMQRGGKSTNASPNYRKKSSSGMLSYMQIPYAQDSQHQLDVVNSQNLINLSQQQQQQSHSMLLQQAQLNQSAQQFTNVLSHSQAKIDQYVNNNTSSINPQLFQHQLDPNLYNQFAQYQSKGMRKSPSNSVIKINPSQIQGYNTHANVSPQAFYRGSLNYVKRKHDIDIINQTNQQLLRALKNAKPSVSRDEHKSHEKRIQKLKQHIGQVRYGSPLNLIIQKPESLIRSYVQSPSRAGLRISKSPKRQGSRGHMTPAQQYLNEVNLEVRPQTQQARRNNKFNQSADFSIHSSQMRQMINTQKYYLPQQEMEQNNNNGLNYQLYPQSHIFNNDQSYKIEVNQNAAQQEQKGENLDDLQGSSRVSSSGNLQIGGTGGADEFVTKKKRRKSSRQQLQFTQTVGRAATPIAMTSYQDQSQLHLASAAQIVHNVSTNSQPQRRVKSRPRGTSQGSRYNQKDLQIISNYQANILGSQFMNTPITRNTSTAKGSNNFTQLAKKQEIVTSVLMPKQEKFAKLPGTVKNIINAQKSIAKNIEIQQKNRQMKLSEQVKYMDQTQALKQSTHSEIPVINKMLESSINKIQPNSFMNYDKLNTSSAQSQVQSDQFYQTNKEDQFLNQMLTPQNYKSPQFNTQNTPSEELQSSLKQQLEDSVHQSEDIKPSQFMAAPQIQINSNPVNFSASNLPNNSKLMRTNTKHMMAMNQDQSSDPWNKSTFETQKMSNQLSFNTSQKEPLKSKLPPEQPMAPMSDSGNQQSQNNLSLLALALKKAKQEKDQMQNQQQLNQVKFPGSMFGALKGAQAFKAGIDKDDTKKEEKNDSNNNLSQLAIALKKAKQEKQQQDLEMKLKISQDEKLKNNKATNILLKSQEKKQRAESKAIRFIQILKQKIIQRKALIMQIQADEEGTKATKNFFGQIMGMAQKAPQQNNGTISIKYSDDSFEMGNQDDFMSPEVEDKEAFEKYLNGNKMIEQKIEQEERDEQMIIDRAQKILCKIQDSILKEKITKKVNKFIEILKDKVIETKQKQVVRRMFGKKLNKFANKDKQTTEEIKSNVLEVEQTMKVADKFLSNLKDRDSRQDQQMGPQKFVKLLKESQRDSATIKEEFNQMSANAKQILISFFQVVWRRVNVKKLVKSFVQILKMSANSSKLEQFNKTASRLYAAQMKPDVTSRIIGLHVRSSHNVFGDSLDSNESLTRLQQDIKTLQTKSPQKKNASELNVKCHTQSKFQERVEAQRREQFFMSKLRESLKNSDSKKINISDEERARCNASSFIRTLQDSSQIKRKAFKLVRLFILILKRKLKDKKLLAERAVRHMRGPKQSEEQTLTTVFSFSNKRVRTGGDSFGLKSINSPELWKSIQWEFKRLVCGLFQRKQEKRGSKIFILYMALEFKQRVIMLLQRDFKTNYGKRDEEKPIYENLKRFLYINNLKQKYLKMKGQLKYQEYVHRCKYFYKRFVNQKAKLRYLISAYKGRELQSVIRSYIAKLFQQKSYQKYIQYNPFRFNVLYSKDVKRFIANLFQNKIDLIGRPRNIFKVRGLKTSQQQVKRFIAYQFQLKNGVPLVNKDAAKKVQPSKNKLKGFVNLMKMKPTTNLKKNDFNFSQIKDKPLWDQLKERTSQLIAKMLQLNSEQRVSRFRALYLGQIYKSQIFDALDQYRFNLIESKGDKILINSLRAFVLLNQIKMKNSQRKGELKSLEYIYRLRFLARRSLNNKKMIQYKLKSASTNQEKYNIFKQLVARLFQQKAFSDYVRYNPFQFNNLTVFQVKRFICDSFQNKRSLVGRPRNIFRQKNKTPSYSQIKLYVAQQFQMKSYNTLKHKFNLLFHRLRVNRIVMRFVRHMMDIHNNLKKRQSNIASQMMQMLNSRFKEQSDHSSRIATAQINSGGDSSYEFDSQDSVGAKATQKQDKVMKEKSQKGQNGFGPDLDSEFEDEFLDADEAETYKKLLKETKAHIKEATPLLQRKVSMYKNNMKNNLANNFKQKLIQGNSGQKEPEEKKMSERENEEDYSANNLKMLAQALKQKKQENAQNQAQQFISGLLQQKQNSEKKQETVQKAVDTFMFKKKDQRAKLIEDDEE